MRIQKVYYFYYMTLWMCKYNQSLTVLVVAHVSKEYFYKY